MAKKNSSISPHAKKLAAVALANGLSRRQVAEALRISHQTVNNWEHDAEFQEEINRLKTVALNGNSYTEYLEQSEQRLIKCASVLRETSIRFLTLANHRLQRINPDDVPVAQLPKFVAAATQALSTSVAIEEQVLGLETIIKHIHEAKDNQAESSD